MKKSEYAPLGTILHDEDEEDLSNIDDSLLSRRQRIKKQQEKQQYVPLWKQEVYDSEGRQRFHGAFTGGFSAGYFNTVGSKEGWVPASFKSSRAERGKPQQRVEDFMDEEDMADAGLINKQLTARSEYDMASSSSSSAKKETVSAREDPLLAHLFGLPMPEEPKKRKEKKREADIGEGLSLSRTSIGVKLLRRMGWKPGEKVGAKQQKDKAKEQSKKRVYSVELPPELKAAREKRDAESEPETAGEDEELDDEDVVVEQEEENYLYQYLTPKTNTRGLGYDSSMQGQKLERLSGLSTRNLKAKSTSSISGNRFGFGALDEFDDEDNSGEARSSTLHRSLLHQQQEEDEEDREEGQQQKHDQRPLLSKQDGRLCTDGRPPLRGFSLATQSSSSASITKHFAPPFKQVPADFKPRHTFTSAESNAIFKWLSSSIFASSSASADAYTQNALQLPSDFSSTAVIAAAAPIAPKMNPALRASVLGEKEIPMPLPASASSVPASKQPGEDEKKKPEPVPVANLFQLPALMSNRFVIGKSQDLAKEHESLISDLRTGKEQKNNKDMSIVDANGDNVYEQAAKMGNFGPATTRQVLDFYPAPLLCKRMDIPNPYPDRKWDESLQKTSFALQRSANAVAELEALFGPSTPPATASAAASIPSSSSSSSFSSSSSAPPPPPLPPVFRSASDHAQAYLESIRHLFTATAPPMAAAAERKEMREDEKAQIRAPMDLFHAIFCDDDKNDQIEKEKQQQQQQQQKKRRFAETKEESIISSSGAAAAAPSSANVVIDFEGMGPSEPNMFDETPAVCEAVVPNMFAMDDEKEEGSAVPNLFADEEFKAPSKHDAIASLVPEAERMPREGATRLVMKEIQEELPLPLPAPSAHLMAPQMSKREAEIAKLQAEMKEIERALAEKQEKKKEKEKRKDKDREAKRKRKEEKKRRKKDERKTRRSKHDRSSDDSSGDESRSSSDSESDERRKRKRSSRKEKHKDRKHSSSHKRSKKSKDLSSSSSGSSSE